MTPAQRRAKRAMDLALLLLVAPVAVLLVAVTAIVVAATIGRPVLFVQHRPGRHGVGFPLVKFRTMRPVDPAGALVADEQRLTPAGRRLRASSLDELPSLWNIARGQMSFVGPRPLLMSYLDRYTARQARRHEVLPGLTGLAQVQGRNAVPWDERLEWDVRYVEGRSLRGDLWILAATIGVLLSRRGVTAPGAATMPEFVGAGDRSGAQTAR
ncbi:sugar transferase [Pilimelia columellifera]|uniref:Sugar transferase n=1 Tax=Pilimelia columellifera subsp. columellifera TaxID=706583 RepID=A0ABN3NPD2_9ACTN